MCSNLSGTVEGPNQAKTVGSRVCSNLAKLLRVYRVCSNLAKLLRVYRVCSNLVKTVEGL